MAGELTRKYYDYVNDELSEELLPGIEKAVEIYEAEILPSLDDDEEHVMCIVIDLENSQLAFSADDGLDLEDAEDESIFATFPCEALRKCAEMCEEADLNLKHEMGHWLADVIDMAADENLFENINTIYGDADYGAGAFDVFYENFGDDAEDEEDYDDEEAYDDKDE